MTPRHGEGGWGRGGGGGIGLIYNCRMKYKFVPLSVTFKTTLTTLLVFIFTCSTHIFMGGSRLSSDHYPCPVSLYGSIIIIIDRFYIALFFALEQTHCARM